MATSTRERRTTRREAAVEAAFALAEREGAAGLTMRRLAQEMKVDATALYRVFQDKDDLILAVCERSIEMTLAAFGDSRPEEPWTEALRRLADASWQVSVDHPVVTALTFARTTGGPAEQRFVELGLSLFAGSGLTRADSVLYYRAFVDAALGLSAQTATLATLDPTASAKDSAAWTRVYAQLPESDFPVAREHAVELGAVAAKQIHDAAIGAIIDAASRAALR